MKNHLLPPPNKDSTVKDVAARAGVSTATVSRVLSNKGGVSERLERRVRQAIKDLSYQPNQSARRLRERRAKIIGVLVPDIQIPFFASLVVAIEETLHDAGYLLLLGNTNDDLAQEKMHISKFLGEDVTGVIFAAANINDTSNYGWLQHSGVALVSIDRWPGDLPVDTVQVDSVWAARDAVQHFINEKHRRIAFIGGPDHISTAVDRRAGYEMALRSSELPVDPGLLQNGDYIEEGGYRAMKTLNESPDSPTAVLIANNVMTLGALKYINEQNLDIPHDIALISFDDMPWASSLRPPLTVVAQPVHEIGVVAARLMLDRIREPQSSVKHVTLETKLILRASCSCGNERGGTPGTPAIQPGI